MRKTIIAAAAAALLIPGIYLLKSSPLILEVDCPETYKVGQMVVIDASQSTAKDLTWLILPDTVNFRIDGKKAYFCSPNKDTYTIIVSGTNGKVVESYPITLKWSGAITPIPVPVPEPVDPFALLLKSWLPESYSKITAFRLAQSFRSVSAISQNSFNDLEAMLLATVYSNKVALGEHLSVWAPFLDALSGHLKDNPPGSIVECSVLWDKIADTLDELIQ